MNNLNFTTAFSNKSFTLTIKISKFNCSHPFEGTHRKFTDRRLRGGGGTHLALGGWAKLLLITNCRKKKLHPSSSGYYQGLYIITYVKWLNVKKGLCDIENR